MLNVAGSLNKVTIEVIPEPILPVAYIKPVEDVEVGESFTLDGSLSTNVDNYRWDQVSGQTLALSRPNEAITSQILTNVDKRSLVTFKLTVDNQDGSDTDFINFYILPRQGNNNSSGNQAVAGSFRDVAEVTITLN